MAVYTVIAVSENEEAPRPCWMIDAVSTRAALQEAWRIREAGRMPWLPPLAALAVRKASRIERAKFAKLMQVRPVSGEITGEEDSSRRAERMASGFFLKLWRGQI